MACWARDELSQRRSEAKRGLTQEFKVMEPDWKTEIFPEDAPFEQENAKDYLNCGTKVRK